MAPLLEADRAGLSQQADRTGSSSRDQQSTPLAIFFHGAAIDDTIGSRMNRELEKVFGRDNYIGHHSSLSSQGPEWERFDVESDQLLDALDAGRPVVIGAWSNGLREQQHVMQMAWNKDASENRGVFDDRKKMAGLQQFLLSDVGLSKDLWGTRKFLKRVPSMAASVASPTVRSGLNSATVLPGHIELSEEELARGLQKALPELAHQNGFPLVVASKRSQYELTESTNRRLRRTDGLLMRSLDRGDRAGVRAALVMRAAVTARAMMSIYSGSMKIRPESDIRPAIREGKNLMLGLPTHAVAILGFLHDTAPGLLKNEPGRMVKGLTRLGAQPPVIIDPMFDQLYSGKAVDRIAQVHNARVYSVFDDHISPAADPSGVVEVFRREVHGVRHIHEGAHAA